MSTTAPLRRIAHYGARYKLRIIFASCCSILNKICDLAPEILIGIAIDIIVNQGHSQMAQVTQITSPFTQLYVIGGLTILLWVGESVFEYLYIISWRTIAQRIQHQLRLQAYDHLQALDMAFFEDKTTGGLLSIVSEDVNNLEDFLITAPNESLQLTTNVLVMGSIFVYLAPAIALCTLLPIPFVVLIANYFQRQLAIYYSQARQQLAVLTTHLTSRINGILNIKSYVAESYEHEQIARESNHYQQALQAAGKVTAAYIPIVRMGILCGFVASLLLGGVYALQGKIAISSYSMLVFLTQRFLWPFTTLTAITDLYEEAMASARRVFTLLDTPKQIHGGTAVLNTPVSGQIDFERVNFTYPNGFAAIQDLTLQIPAKSTVAFVGATGSGKSTIIKLLLRLYDCQQGQISIDQTNIKTLTLADLRHQIALASQDIYLVDGTVADNIRYGTFAATDEQVVAAAKLSNAHEFILALPNGYETLVGENGKNLSGGQRQRLSLARALLKNPAIYIFDEATSAVDNETEQAIQQSLATLAGQHTMIMIAHRLSTVRQADQIFVMEQGRVIEIGTHDELLAKAGVYANLWQIQTGGESAV